MIDVNAVSDGRDNVSSAVGNCRISIAGVTPWACPITASFIGVIETIRSNPDLMAVIGDKPLPAQPRITFNHVEFVERREELAFYAKTLLAVVDWRPDNVLPQVVRDFLRWY